MSNSMYQKITKHPLRISPIKCFIHVCEGFPQISLNVDSVIGLFLKNRPKVQTAESPLHRICFHCQISGNGCEWTRLQPKRCSFIYLLKMNEVTYLCEFF